MLKIYFRPKINFCNSNFTYKIQISYFRPMSLMALIMYNFKNVQGADLEKRSKVLGSKITHFSHFGQNKN